MKNPAPDPSSPAPFDGRKPTTIRGDLGRRLLACAALTPGAALVGDGVDFTGTWRTTFGLVRMEQKGDRVTGAYGPENAFTLEGSVADRTLRFRYREGEAEGEGAFTLAPSGDAFEGNFKILATGRAGTWKGWRPDPEAEKGTARDFSGLWLTDLGLMEIEQKGATVSARYAYRGTSSLEGDARGRRLSFRYEAFGSGSGWFDLSEDGTRLSGAYNPDGRPNWYGWNGRPAPEYARPLAPKAGEIASGRTKNLLAVHVRAPEGYDSKTKGKKWPAVVLLHGSNMNSRAYVHTFAAAWPALARERFVIGIDGETPSNLGPEPAFNYTYVNFVGKSTYGGYPGTDRESPALVSEAVEELRDALPLGKVFVGGHSQGGFLTYSLLMNYPRLFDGAFPISCGLIFQCEPEAYADEALREAQRLRPLAVVHGRNDEVVGFGMGLYAAQTFEDGEFPALRLFADESAGHLFARLPVDEAVRWLEAHASEDPKELLDFADGRAGAEEWRDAAVALRRAKSLDAKGRHRTRIAAFGRRIDEAASAEAKRLEARIRENRDGSWVDPFLEFRAKFEFADAAKGAMEAFRRLREQHAKPAQDAFDAARKAFNQGRREEGYARYREIVEKHYASRWYRHAKRWLEERK